ncbi:Uncharacterised protein [Nocardia brasiliensis]|nr:Uncharacterised protein [Nocardia brasiliensis]
MRAAVAAVAARAASGRSLVRHVVGRAVVRFHLGWFHFSSTSGGFDSGGSTSVGSTSGGSTFGGSTIPSRAVPRQVAARSCRSCGAAVAAGGDAEVSLRLGGTLLSGRAEISALAVAASRVRARFRFGWQQDLGRVGRCGAGEAGGVRFEATAAHGLARQIGTRWGDPGVARASAQHGSPRASAQHGSPRGSRVLSAPLGGLMVSGPISPRPVRGLRSCERGYPRLGRRVLYHSRTSSAFAHPLCHAICGAGTRNWCVSSEGGA